MARRDLSRTAIEGGRYYRNSFERRHSHRYARTEQRAWLVRARLDPEAADDAEEPSRPHVPRMFYDKLAPMYRWLVSQCGRPWSKVHAEVRERFDTRTTAGRHILFDHLLRSVWWNQFERLDEAQRLRVLYVDAHGILRRGKYYGMRYQHVVRRLAEEASRRNPR